MPRPAIEPLLGQFCSEYVNEQHEADHQEKFRGEGLKIEEGTQRRIGKQCRGGYHQRSSNQEIRFRVCS